MNLNAFCRLIWRSHKMVRALEVGWAKSGCKRCSPMKWRICFCGTSFLANIYLISSFPISDKRWSHHRISHHCRVTNLKQSKIWNWEIVRNFSFSALPLPLLSIEMNVVFVMRCVRVSFRCGWKSWNFLNRNKQQKKTSHESFMRFNHT